MAKALEIGGWSLVPVLQSGEKAIIEMDGTRGYGSSFLEEAFGGLVRKGFAPDQVRHAFELRSSDPSLIFEVEEYIAHGADVFISCWL